MRQCRKENECYGNYVPLRAAIKLKKTVDDVHIGDKMQKGGLRQHEQIGKGKWRILYHIPDEASRLLIRQHINSYVHHSAGNLTSAYIPELSTVLRLIWPHLANQRYHQ